MNLRKATLVSLAAFFALSTEAAFACGDKFLIVGRGSRFQRAYVAVHPASLLLVNGKVTGQRELQTALKVAGHSVRVANTAELPETYKSGRFDFVLADFRDVDAVGELLPTGGSATLLPVVDGSSDRDFAAASKRYNCLLGHGRSTKANRHFLAGLDAAMDSKLKKVPLHCDVK